MMDALQIRKVVQWTLKNTVIIMTSNIGSAHLLDGLEEDGSIKEESRDLVMGQLRGHFRPEFLNRVDEIILFKPLTTNEIKGIVDKIVKRTTRSSS